MKSTTGVSCKSHVHDITAINFQNLLHCPFFYSLNLTFGTQADFVATFQTLDVMLRNIIFFTEIANKLILK